MSIISFLVIWCELVLINMNSVMLFSLVPSYGFQRIFFVTCQSNMIRRCALVI